MLSRAAIPIIAATALALASAPAAADDAAVFKAFHSRDRAMRRALQDYTSALVRAGSVRRPGRRELKAIIAADKRMNLALAQVGAAVGAQQSSTANGERAKVSVLAETSAWQRANNLEILAYRAALGGHIRRANRLIHKGVKIMRRETFPAGRKAARAFHAAGFKRRPSPLVPR